MSALWQAAISPSTQHTAACTLTCLHTQLWDWGRLPSPTLPQRLTSPTQTYFKCLEVNGEMEEEPESLISAAVQI